MLEEQKDQAERVRETGNGPTLDNEQELIDEEFPDES